VTEPLRLGAAERQASQALIDAYAESWQRIADAQQRLLDDPLNARKRARLNELADMVSPDCTPNCSRRPPTSMTPPRR
jgi:hypothetical protein